MKILRDQGRERGKGSWGGSLRYRRAKGCVLTSRPTNHSHLPYPHLYPTCCNSAALHRLVICIITHPLAMLSNRHRCRKNEGDTAKLKMMVARSHVAALERLDAKIFIAILSRFELPTYPPLIRLADHYSTESHVNVASFCQYHCDSFRNKQ